MNKRTIGLIIGVGIVSVLTGTYAGYKSGEWIDSISGVFIGLALVGTAILERKKKTEKP